MIFGVVLLSVGWCDSLIAFGLQVTSAGDASAPYAAAPLSPPYNNKSINQILHSQTCSLTFAL
jgi:hypothetical protein